MILQAHRQFRGIADIDKPDGPDIDWRHRFAEWSALPTGVVYTDAVTSGNDESSGLTFEGLNGGRLGMPTTSAETRYLRFDGWDLADPDIFRRVIFDIEGVYFPDSKDIRFFFSLRDTSTQTGHGVLFSARIGAGQTNVSYNNGSSAVTTVIPWQPVDQGRNIKHTIGVGFEIEPSTGTKSALLLVNGLVTRRDDGITLGLGASLRPYLAMQMASGTGTAYAHGARLRCWRHT